MKKFISFVSLFIFAIGFLFPLLASAQKSKPKLVFSDEFDGLINTPVDDHKWTSETGGGGWGNKEFQYYTAKIENAFHDGSGSLVIRAVKQDLPENFKCWYGACKYTSARLITKNKFEKTYGRFEARIKIPRGPGMWPAFWMLGNDIDKAGWPKCGEIDILENIGRDPLTVHGTIHGPGYSGDKGIGLPYELPERAAFSDDFHVYSVVWTKNKIEWFVDGKRYQTISSKDLPRGEKWVFDHPFFMILNLAVGGNWPGPPDETTVFPSEMLIDYVRVYDR